MQKRWTIIEILNWSADFLARKGICEPRLEAEILLAWCLACPRIGLYTSFENIPDEEPLDRFRKCLTRRAGREPSQYITGRAEFFSLPVCVTPDVLIPRGETEVLVENVLELSRTAFPDSGSLRIVDAGTGSGAIAIALARNLPDAELLATDRSAAALDIARANAENNDVAGAIKFAAGDFLEPVHNRGWAGSVNIVVSNPPYISETEFAGLQDEVRLFEPREALVAGPTGLEAFQRLAPVAGEILAPGGWLCVEVGAGQAQNVAGILTRAGHFKDISIRDDFAGIPRVVSGRR